MDKISNKYNNFVDMSGEIYDLVLPIMEQYRDVICPNARKLLDSLIEIQPKNEFDIQEYIQVTNKITEFVTSNELEKFNEMTKTFKIICSLFNDTSNTEMTEFLACCNKYIDTIGEHVKYNFSVTYDIKEKIPYAIVRNDFIVIRKKMNNIENEINNIITIFKNESEYLRCFELKPELYYDVYEIEQVNALIKCDSHVEIFSCISNYVINFLQFMHDTFHDIVMKLKEEIVEFVQNNVTGSTTKLLKAFLRKKEYHFTKLLEYAEYKKYINTLNIMMGFVPPQFAEIINGSDLYIYAIINQTIKNLYKYSENQPFAAKHKDKVIITQSWAYDCIYTYYYSKELYLAHIKKINIFFEKNICQHMLHS